MVMSLTVTVVFLSSLVASVSACGAGYETFYGGRCMKVSTRSVEAIATNFDKQQAKCTDEGTYMAMLKTQPDEQALMQLSKEQFSDHSIFIGLECDIAAGHFKWQDGSAVTYMNENLQNKCKSTERKLLNPSTKHWEGIDFLFTVASFCQEEDEIGYPDSNVGDCAKMDVATGKWKSTRCTDHLNFICGRPIKALLPHVSADCPSIGKVYGEGEHIYAPGWPYAQENVNCLYNIQVPKGKRALLQIVFLETNLKKDFLYLRDDGHEIADLTGSNHAGETFMSESNVMKMQYTTEVNANVRGFHVIVKAI